MSQLIKSETSAHQGRVRGLPRGGAFEPPAPSKSAAELELAALRGTMETLAADLAARDTEIERLRRRAVEAYDEGETAGRERGLKEADQAVERSLAVLTAGVEMAVQHFKVEIASLERLAPLLAKQGLEKILGDPANHANLLSASIGHHLRGIEAAAVVRIEVSTQDFPNADDIAALRSGAGCPGAEIVSIEQLPAGACRVKLRLGSLDIGMDTQWPRLSDLLDHVSLPAATV